LRSWAAASASAFCVCSWFWRVYCGGKVSSLALASMVFGSCFSQHQPILSHGLIYSLLLCFRRTSLSCLAFLSSICYSFLALAAYKSFSFFYI
jgi:hypothetical protein